MIISEIDGTRYEMIISDILDFYFGNKDRIDKKATEEEKFRAHLEANKGNEP